MKAIIWIYGISLLFLLCGCNKGFEDTPQEDYERLFPFRGIDRPKPGEEPVVRLGNPFLVERDFQYPGKEGIVPSRDYTITVKAAYYETNVTSVKPAPSAYYIRFVNGDKKLVTWASAAFKDRKDVELQEGMEHHETFRLKSGNVVYLIVNGHGERGTSVKGSITVKDENGLLVLPTLSTFQHQNQEGPNLIPIPFCQYYILP